MNKNIIFDNNIYSVGYFLLPCLIVIVTEEFFIFSIHKTSSTARLYGSLFLYLIFLFFPITLTDVFNLTLFLSARNKSHNDRAAPCPSLAEQLTARRTD